MFFANTASSRPRHAQSGLNQDCEQAIRSRRSPEKRAIPPSTCRHEFSRYLAGNAEFRHNMEEDPSQEHLARIWLYILAFLKSCREPLQQGRFPPPSRSFPRL